jgi:adenine/guanine phosphoribosyltransferase-like PRPP-binding protein
MPANTSRRYKDKQIDKVIGVESRFFFGMLLAQELNVGFIPVRNLINYLMKRYLPVMI